MPCFVDHVADSMVLTTPEGVGTGRGAGNCCRYIGESEAVTGASSLMLVVEGRVVGARVKSLYGYSTPEPILLLRYQ